MNLRREATKTIWKTVVFAGAMLGSAACSKKPAPVAPTEATGDNANPCADTEPNPCDVTADPCADNPCRDRGNPCDGEGETGRGFILS
jgi:hypothetical protein